MQISLPLVFSFLKENCRLADSTIIGSTLAISLISEKYQKILGRTSFKVSVFFQFSFHCQYRIVMNNLKTYVAKKRNLKKLSCSIFAYVMILIVSKQISCLGT